MGSQEESTRLEFSLISVKKKLIKRLNKLIIYLLKKSRISHLDVGDQTFHRVWSCLIKFEGHQTFDQTTQNISCVLVCDEQCFVRLDSHIKHVWRAHVYHACSAACIHRYHVLFTNVACSLFTVLKIAEIGDIGTEETPSRKGNQSKGKATKSIITECMQVQQASVSRENCHESFASFRGNLEYLLSTVPYDIVVAFLFSLSSPRSSLVYLLFFPSSS